MTEKIRGKKVLAFGAFDPLHAGHLFFFREAKALGDFLSVIVARDESIEIFKKRKPFQQESQRIKAVSSVSDVDMVLPGMLPDRMFDTLKTIDFDVVAMGYDQSPSDEQLRCKLEYAGKNHVQIVRIASFYPERYKSTLIRSVIQKEKV